MAYFGKYTLPADIARDENLSDEEKISLLTQWRDDKKALLRATEEGMHGNDRPDILKQIKQELSALQKASTSDI